MSTTIVTVSGTVATPNGGMITLGIPAVVNASAVGAESNPVLDSTPQTFLRPTGTVGVIVQPPQGNTIAMTLTTNTNTEGVHLAPDIGTGGVIGLASDVAQINLSSDSTMMLPVQLIWV